jgi:acetyl-CoA synthetase
MPSYSELRRDFRWEVPERFNIGIACSDRQRAKATAVVEFDMRGEHRRFTFGDLRRDSNRLANALVAKGVARGERVGLLIPQSFAAAAAHLGIYKAGAVVLPLSELFGPDALRHRLRDAGVTLLFAAPDLTRRVASLCGELGVELVADLAGFSARASARAPGISTSADDPAFVIYTSGTTANPKGVLHAHRSLLGHLPGFELSHDFFPQERDLFWTPADWAWIGGLMDALMPTLFHGHPIVAGPRRRFDPELAARVIVELGVRNLFAPPTALRLMKGADIALPRETLRTVMSGGEKLGADTLEWARASLGVTVAEIYGQTEANYVVGNCPTAWEVRPGSMGLPYPGHEVAVLAVDGEVGEIAVRVPDPVAFLGYLNDAEATAAKHRDDWLLTGDLARQDEDGYLWFESRADDLIISAGYRISPLEVEQCLLGHPAVTAAAVIGIPDQLRGEVVKAFVIPRDGRGGDTLRAELQSHVRSRLAAYEYPRSIEFVAELPLTVSGKIRRRALAERERHPAADIDSAP